VEPGAHRGQSRNEPAQNQPERTINSYQFFLFSEPAANGEPNTSRPANVSARQQITLINTPPLMAMDIF
jgi:hypothetical protein